VVPLSAPLTLFASSMNMQPDEELEDYATEEDLCKSMKQLPPHGGEKENHAKQLDPYYVVCKQSVVKPHPAYIPTLTMPKMATIISNNGLNNQHLVHIPTTSLKAPMPGSLPGACAMAQYAPQPRVSTIMSRGPMR